MKERKSTKDRQREIAEAALKIISEQGLRKFTSAAIAAEVGITDGTVFRHFPNKESIVDAALERAEEILFEGFPPEAEDPLERLGLFFKQRAATALSNRAIVRLALSDELLHATGEAGALKVAAWRERSIDFIKECFIEAYSQKLLREDILPPALIMIVYGGILALSAADKTALMSMGSSVDMLWENIEKLMRV
ncbi:TetR/AcrR family transcriptional regulator [Myxococcota bacterium]|nr:TetR/AcrR family transcriptional regulator [Myxococcota bacterium]